MVFRMNRLDSSARSSHANTQEVMMLPSRVTEAELVQRLEEQVPVDLALADVEVLVHPDRVSRAG